MFFIQSLKNILLSDLTVANLSLILLPLLCQNKNGEYNLRLNLKCK